jgi:DHA1 family bicyclomycin/chloramphenicol resistance-like MFS transporter
MIGGMVLGAYMSGRAAGRITGARLAGIGFACCGVAATANLIYNGLVSELTLPWAVLPMVLNAFGIALVFPILTLAILDMYPRQRGSASSLQAFTGLVLHSLVAGVISPFLSHEGMHLAIGAAVLTLLGWLLWRWENRAGRRLPDCPAEAAALEPTERL